MPTYIYSNPADENEVVEIIQTMSETHEYIKDGDSCPRVWTNPQVAFEGLKVDPYSEKDFVRKTAGGGTVGDLIDRSAEMSDLRAARNGGADPIAVERAINKKIALAEQRKKASDERKLALKKHREKE